VYPNLEHTYFSNAFSALFIPQLSQYSHVGDKGILLEVKIHCCKADHSRNTVKSPFFVFLYAISKTLQIKVTDLDEIHILYYVLFYTEPLFIKIMKSHLKYEGRLQSSSTHLITPSRNFVEVR